MLTIDASDLKRVMTNLKAAEDQMPFAMSLALNEATRNTRKHLIGVTWPTSGVTVRNKSFIGAALVMRDTPATKRNLTTEIYDRLGRANLMLHAKGGTRTAKGGRMAIPVSGTIKRTARGVPDRWKPKTLGPKLFRKDSGEARYTRDGRGRLKLTYVLKTATKIPKRVRFYEDFNTVMRREVYRAIPKAVERAMATRRVR